MELWICPDGGGSRWGVVRARAATRIHSPSHAPRRTRPPACTHSLSHTTPSRHQLPSAARYSAASSPGASPPNRPRSALALPPRSLFTLGFSASRRHSRSPILLVTYELHLRRPAALRCACACACTRARACACMCVCVCVFAQVRSVLGGEQGLARAYLQEPPCAHLKPSERQPFFCSSTRSALMRPR